MALSGAVQWRFVFFSHSPTFLRNKHSNCTRNAGLGKPAGWRASAFDVQMCSWSLGMFCLHYRGLWVMVRGVTASFSPPSQPSSRAQLVAQLRDSPADSSPPLSFSCTKRGQDFTVPFKTQPFKQLSHSKMVMVFHKNTDCNPALDWRVCCLWHAVTNTKLMSLANLCKKPKCRFTSDLAIKSVTLQSCSPSWLVRNASDERSSTSSAWPQFTL